MNGTILVDLSSSSPTNKPLARQPHRWKLLEMQMERRTSVIQRFPQPQELGFAPTTEENAYFQQVWRKCVPNDSDNYISAQNAAAVLQRSRLPKEQLKEVWNVVDVTKSGNLDKIGWWRALKLIASLQNGGGMTFRATPLPQLDGLPYELEPSLTTPFPTNQPPFSREERQKWLNIFASSSQNGVLVGDAARALYMKSGLPVETLKQVWNLCDTQKRGFLDSNEFLASMWVLSRVRSNQLTSVPPNLSTVWSYVVTGEWNPSVPPSPNPPFVDVKPFPSSAPSFSAPSLPPSANLDGWLVTPQEKKNYDRYFDAADQGSKGYLTGEEAYRVFAVSKLPQDSLTKVWSLCNISGKGQLSREEFAVGMTLLRQARAGQPIPNTLPENLIPPSMRQSSVLNESMFNDVMPVSSSTFSPVPAERTMTIGTILKDMNLARSATGDFKPTPMSTPAVAPTQSTPFSPLPTGINPGVKAPPGSIPEDDELVSELTSEVTKTTQDVKMLESQAATLSITKQNLADKHAALEADLENIIGKKTEISAKVTELKVLVDQAKVQVGKLEQDHGKQEEELRTMRDELDQLTKEYEELNQKKEGWSGDLSQWQQERDTLVPQIAQLKEQLQNVNGEIQQVQHRYEAESGDLDKLKLEYKQVQEELHAAQADLAEQQRSLTDLNAETQATKRAVAEARQRVQTLTSNVEQVKGQVDHVRQELSQAKQELENVPIHVEAPHTEAPRVDTVMAHVGSVAPVQAVVEVVDASVPVETNQVVSPIESELQAMEAKAKEVGSLFAPQEPAFDPDHFQSQYPDLDHELEQVTSPLPVTPAIISPAESSVVSSVISPRAISPVESPVTSIQVSTEQVQQVVESAIPITSPSTSTIEPATPQVPPPPQTTPPRPPQILPPQTTPPPLPPQSTKPGTDPFSQPATVSDFDKEFENAFDDVDPTPAVVNPTVDSAIFDNADDAFEFKASFDAPKDKFVDFNTGFDQPFETPANDSSFADAFGPVNPSGTDPFDSSSPFENAFEADFSQAFPNASPAVTETPTPVSIATPTASIQANVTPTTPTSQVRPSNPGDDPFLAIASQGSSGGAILPRTTSLRSEASASSNKEEDIPGVSQVMEITGVDRTRALDALSRYDFNVEKAINFILS